jgi:hypothetical protein
MDRDEFCFEPVQKIEPGKINSKATAFTINENHIFCLIIAKAFRLNFIVWGCRCNKVASKVKCYTINGFSISYAVTAGGLLEATRIGKWTYYKRNEEGIEEISNYIAKKV